MRPLGSGSLLIAVVPFLLASLPLAALPGRAAAEDVVVARFGKETLTLAQFDRHLAARFRSREEGRDALLQIARLRIVEREAARRGVVVSDEDLRKKRAEIDRTMKAAGEGGIEALLRDQRVEAADFDRTLRLGIAHERLARADLGLGPDDALAPDRLEAWLQERLGEEGSETRPTPQGGSPPSAAGRPVTEEELGRAIRYGVGPQRARELLLDAVGTRIVEARAASLGVALRPGDLETEIERRRARVAREPSLHGLTYEDLLRMRGSSLEETRDDPMLKTAALLDRIVDRLYPKERLAEAFAREREGLEARHGEGRRVHAILFPVVGPAGEREFAEAEREARALAERVENREEFERLARERLPDNDGRERGGDLGVVRRNQPGVDPAILETAFAAKPGAVAGPVRAKGGVALLFVSEVVPSPGPDALLDRLRVELRGRLYREWIAEAAPTTYFD